MMTLLVHRFMIYSILDMLCLYIGCFILKKYAKGFPEQYIPVVAVVLSIIVSIIWCYGGAITAHPFFYVFVGFIQGLATVGLHQLIKQIRERFYFKKQEKILKENNMRRKKVE